MRRAAVCFLGIASPAVLACLLVDHPAAEATLAVLVALFPVALVLLSVGHERLSGLGGWLAGLGLLQVASLLGMLLLRGRVMTAPWIGGLPAAAAILVYGVVLGLILVVAAYALTFERFGLGRQDLDSLRARFGRGEEPRAP